MPTMTFSVNSNGQSAAARHNTQTAEFWSGEQRMGGDPKIPNPLELLLASLTGCMNVVLQMVVSESQWNSVSATFHATGELDSRGLMGDPTVAPYFQHVELLVKVSGLSPTDLDDMREKVGRRCPVHRLMDKAGIEIHEVWQIAEDDR